LPDLNADKIPVHVVLLGHIDHGKTKLARQLSDVISTAGLDKHPQSKERGITIDLGFTAFTLKNYLVTLIDAPGHADLIRSVVAASTIADAAILVVAANEGPKIQTGEHVLILDGFKIKNVIVALTKIDLIRPEEIPTRIKQVRSILSGTSLVNVPIIPVSGLTGDGIQALKEALVNILSPPERLLDGQLKMPVDHAFSVKGSGTVMTGTIHRGRVSIGDLIEIYPDRQGGRVRSIQVFKQSREKAKAGDRVGIAVAGLDPNRISRGCYMATPGSLRIVQELEIKAKMNGFYKGGLHPKMMVHLTIGMPTVSGTVYPYVNEDGKKIIKEKVEPGEEFNALIRLGEKITAEVGDPVLISRLDLPVTSLRILGSGNVINMDIEAITFFREKIKQGMVRGTHQRGYILDQIARSKIGAEKFLNLQVKTYSGIKGTITETFGTKGSVIAEMERDVQEGDVVFVRILRKYKL